MRSLNSREKWLLGACFGVVLIVATGFVSRSVMKVLRGSESTIRTLKNELADQEMWLEEMPKIEAREKWLSEKMPGLGGASIGKLQGDLLETLQDEIFDRKLKIEQQSLQDVETEAFYTEVAVRLIVRGEEKVMLEWLTTLQNPDMFQVIKAIELKPDLKSKEVEPQSICQITIARWYFPDDGGKELTGSAGEKEIVNPSKATASKG